IGPMRRRLEFLRARRADLQRCAQSEAAVRSAPRGASAPFASGYPGLAWASRVVANDTARGNCTRSVERCKLQRRPRPPDLLLGARARINSVVARSYPPRSPSALATTIAPVMVANSSAALFGESPHATSLSRHILKKRFTSAATSGGRSNDPAPSTVHG